ncbi:MAG: SusD/RagB family nutrient-binding outer membrane lipoprotein [Adhaeribacter sp.]
MKIKNKYILAALFASTLGLSSCEDFLDINDDPNNPANSTPALTLPAGLGELGYILGNQFQFLGNYYAQHWTQAGAANQYCDLEQYQMTSSSYDTRVWAELYAGALNDFKYVADQGNASNNPNYAAIGEIMQAYTFQVVTDAWGDVPFASALASLDNLSPEYQSQEAIYAGIITMLDAAIAKIDEDAKTPGRDDLVFGGDMDLWRKFANTLKLRVYLRQAYVKPAVAEAGIKAMYASGAQFLETGETADVEFADQTQNRNPFFQSQVTFRGGVDVVASNTALSLLQQNADARLDKFYAAAEDGANKGQFTGIDQGVECTPAREGKQATNYSKPGPAVASPTTAVPLISAAESYFLQAEAVARNWTNGTGNAAALYAQGVRASFDYVGESDAEATALLQKPGVAYAGGSVEAQVEQIITQKWLSFNGTQGFEAWTEYRRTGYPSFIEPSAASTLGGSLLPKRILYPNSEATRNQNYPGLKEVSVAVWWDVKD